MSSDPIEESGGINLHSYVGGNPTNNFDPDGLAPEKYVVYVKLNPRTKKVYVGRSSGPITSTLEQIVRNRDSGHHVRGFGPAIPIGETLDYNAIRGLEERAIHRYGGSISAGGSTANKYRGISLKNKNRKAYLAASRRIFGNTARLGTLFSAIDRIIGAWTLPLEFINLDGALRRSVDEGNRKRGVPCTPKFG